MAQNRIWLFRHALLEKDSHLRIFKDYALLANIKYDKSIVKDHKKQINSMRFFTLVLPLRWIPPCQC